MGQHKFIVYIMQRLKLKEYLKKIIYFDRSVSADHGLCCLYMLIIIERKWRNRSKFGLPYLFAYKMGILVICYMMGFFLPEQSKDLDPSYKMDLDFWVVLEGEKITYNQ